MVYSGYRILSINTDYNAEAKMRMMLMEYKPYQTQCPSEEIVEIVSQNGTDLQDKYPGETGLRTVPNTNTEKIVNQSMADLQEKYPDAAGWLTIPNTNIDYPFAWYKDNEYYLRRDLNGNYALAGTIFMDYRCKKDFTSQNTIIYGHHMKNRSMFNNLILFNDEKFFNENKTGTIYLPHATLTMEFFAYMVVNPATEYEIYNSELSDDYLEYVKQNARYYRDVEITDSDNIVTLSTCSYEFNNARMVLLSKIIRISF